MNFNFVQKVRNVSELSQSESEELKTVGRTSELSQSESEELKTVGRTYVPSEVCKKFRKLLSFA